MSAMVRITLALLAGLLPALVVMPLQAAPAEIVVDAAQRQALGIRIGVPAAVQEIPLPQLPAQVLPAAGQAEAVTAPYAGVVTWIGAYEGDQVRAGQVLARVRSRESMVLDADLRAAASAAAAAGAQAQRDQALLHEGIIAAARAEASAAVATAAQARMAELRAARAQAPAARQAGEYELRAPFAGRVLMREAELGAAMPALGMAFSVGREGARDLEIQVPAGLRALLHPGLAVQLPDGTRGKVLAVGAALDADSQSVKLRAHVQAAHLLPGQRIAVDLVLPAPQATWKVPAAAVARDGRGAATVYRSTARGFMPVQVQVIGQTENDLYVQGALRGNSRIALGGALLLSTLEGSK